MKRSNRDRESFDEDDMPCLCPCCTGWFDLSDGERDPLDDGRVICEDCACERQEVVDRQEEIRELLDNISDAEHTIKDAKALLDQLKYKEGEERSFA